jgi:histidyl-tRNA synthetase
VDLLSRRLSRDAVAVLVEGEVPVADALAVAREMRRAAGPAAVVEVVRRSGKFAAQLKRLEAAGFGGFVVVRAEDGVIVTGELRALGGEPDR